MFEFEKSALKIIRIQCKTKICFYCKGYTFTGEGLGDRVGSFSVILEHSVKS